MCPNIPYDIFRCKILRLDKHFENIIASKRRFCHLGTRTLSKLQSLSHTRAMEEAAARERKRPREGDAAPSAAAGAGAGAWKAQYVYLPIADALKVLGARVFLFAAVSEIGAAVRSRGTGEPQVSTPPSLPSFLPPASARLLLGFSLGFSRVAV